METTHSKDNSKTDFLQHWTMNCYSSIYRSCPTLISHHVFAVMLVEHRVLSQEDVPIAYHIQKASYNASSNNNNLNFAWGGSAESALRLHTTCSKYMKDWYCLVWTIEEAYIGRMAEWIESPNPGAALDLQALFNTQSCVYVCHVCCHYPEYNRLFNW